MIIKMKIFFRIRTAGVRPLSDPDMNCNVWLWYVSHLAAVFSLL